MKSHEQRLGAALEIVEGLSVGDALGEALSYQHHRAREIADFSIFSPGSVRYTDATEMALAVCETLKLIRGIDEDTIAWAYSSRHLSTEQAGSAIWQAVLDYTPESKVRTGISRAQSMSASAAIEVVREVGNGAGISAQDTVPFCIWSACRNLADFREALLSTVEMGGDCDTNCAIVCGIVSAYGGVEAIPKEWINVRELLAY